MKITNAQLFFLFTIFWVAACQNVKSIEDGASQKDMYIAYRVRITDSGGAPAANTVFIFEGVKSASSGTSGQLQDIRMDIYSSVTDIGKKIVTSAYDGTIGFVGDVKVKVKSGGAFVASLTKCAATVQLAGVQSGIACVKGTADVDFSLGLATTEYKVGDDVVVNRQNVTSGSWQVSVEAMATSHGGTMAKFSTGKVGDPIDGVSSGTGGGGSSGSTSIGCCTLSDYYGNSANYPLSQASCYAYYPTYGVSYSPNSCP